MMRRIQAEALRIAEEIVIADWEAWKIAEGQNRDKLSQALDTHDDERDRY